MTFLLQSLGQSDAPGTLGFEYRGSSWAALGLHGQPVTREWPGEWISVQYFFWGIVSDGADMLILYDSQVRHGRRLGL